jgi:metal-dependent amidase/aminoacylase/carboxypeptidase family protein
MGLNHEAAAVAGVTNTPALVDRAVATVRHTLGESSIRLIETMIPAFSEDFGSFQSRVPGAFFFLGVSNPAKNTVGMPHSPDYVADDGAIAVGVRAMTAVLIDALR